MSSPAPAPDDLDLLTTTPERIVYTLELAAIKLGGIHASKLGRMFNNGEIGGYRIGRRIFLTQADIDEYIANGRAASPLRQASGPEPTHVHLVRRQGDIR